MGGGRSVPACRAIFAVRKEGLGWGVEMSRPERFMRHMSGSPKWFQFFSPRLKFFFSKSPKADLLNRHPARKQVNNLFLMHIFDFQAFGNFCLRQKEILIDCR
jgi:hypothetical protein